MSMQKFLILKNWLRPCAEKDDAFDYIYLWNMINLTKKLNVLRRNQLEFMKWQFEHAFS